MVSGNELFHLTLLLYSCYFTTITPISRWKTRHSNRFWKCKNEQKIPKESQSLSGEAMNPAVGQPPWPMLLGTSQSMAGGSAREGVQ
jgi:hypothetical protein